MAQIVAPFFAPDLDNAWSVAPGALASLNAFAPLQNGNYGSVGTASLFNLTGSDILHGQTFKQVAGTVRLLMFRPGNIDEYDNVGTRTNRGTGYNAATTAWSAAAWGNQIIACNYLDATQSSSGAGFAGLGGGSPKARYVAANLKFVMLADVDDGGSNVFSDMVWWCGIRNPATWAPALATQAGNERLLDAPGPIRGIVAFRDTFVIFKDNAFWVAEYIGVGPNQFIFDFRLVSAKIGCIAPQTIVELDGKLYFLHSSGFYEFDGQSLKQIGLPVFQSFLRDAGYITRATGLSVSLTPEGVSLAQAAVDDIEGVVWFRSAYKITASSQQTMTLYGYNARSGKWGKHQVATGQGATAWPRLAFTNFAEQQSFLTGAANRLWVVWNDSTSTFRAVKYPIATTDTVAATYTTGVFGSVDGSDLIDKHYVRTIEGTDLDTGVTAAINGYTSENKLKTNGVALNGTYNTEFDEIDIRINARFKTVAPTWTVGKLTLLGGIGFNGKPGGKR